MTSRRHINYAVSPASERRLDFSFACGGYLKMYEFGVAKALQQFELERNGRLIGCSAGALAATGLALQCDFDAIRDHVLKNVVPKAHGSLSGLMSTREYLMDTLHSQGRLHEYAKLNASQQLTVVYTSLSSVKSRRVTSFASKNHLEKCLKASCCATPIAGMPFRLNGEWVMDGCILDFQPVYDEKTVTVSPFYCTGADIKPSVYVPMWWAMVPPGAIVCGSKAVVFGAAAKLLVSNIIVAVLAVALATLGLQHTMLILLSMAAAWFLLGGAVLLVGGLHEAALVASQDWRQCRSCIKRHEFLMQSSLVYRVALRFI
ncbi:hypothetical protein BBJ29_000491 [Phytophthora kernoviae]|uniref:PNPLA domain-containing protein n=1 Tax=Phytophthora kernoviae TaxID=325452 RepID=A0A3F2S4I5_9STRA|nr:hypothetical protein BBJ29_000491 [Phytophthora kernoviae]RLN69985.1 hypothetical protein BBP00_00000101 [Phytophthora kernoviae]